MPAAGAVRDRHVGAVGGKRYLWVEQQLHRPGAGRGLRTVRVDRDGEGSRQIHDELDLSAVIPTTTNCGGPSASPHGHEEPHPHRSRSPRGDRRRGLFGGVLRETPTRRPAELARRAAGGGLQGRLRAERSTAALVAGLQAQLRANPKDEHSLARCSGSPTSSAPARPATRPTTRSPRARSDRALALDPKDSLATSGLGSLALSRHRFARGARARPSGPVRPRPTTARNYGVIGDALVELGRYPRGLPGLRPMNTLRPEPVLVRARLVRARAARPHGAARSAAMKLALDAATGSGEPSAWTHVQLGKLYFNHGRYAPRPSASTALALQAFPGYAYGLDALAQVQAGARALPAGDRGRAAGGRRDPAAAVRRARSATSTASPASRGSPARQYALIGAIERLLSRTASRPTSRPRSSTSTTGSASGTRSRSPALARAERPSIDGDDVLAWALGRNGRCAEALPHSSTRSGSARRTRSSSSTAG